MNWTKPSNTQYPAFKKVVLGLQLPNRVSLVKLDRIDESGPVFHRAASRSLLDEVFLTLFSDEKTNMGESTSILATEVNIDMYAEIELPKDQK